MYNPEQAIDLAKLHHTSDAVMAYYSKTQGVFGEVKSLYGEMSKLHALMQEQSQDVGEIHNRSNDLVEKILALSSKSEEEANVFRTHMEDLITNATTNLKSIEETQTARFQELDAQSRAALEQLFTNFTSEIEGYKSKFTTDLDTYRSDTEGWLANFKGTNESAASATLDSLQQMMHQAEDYVSQTELSKNNAHDQECLAFTSATNAHEYENQAANAANQAQQYAQMAAQAVQQQGGGFNWGGAINGAVDTAEAFIPGLSLISNPIQGIFNSIF